MKKSAIVLFSALLSLSVFAQSVQEGISHLYAERYQSAKSVFDKLISSNPNNIEANYWLGQLYIKTKDTAAALSQYQKLLAANGNAPLALVGMGQVELMQGKTAEARQHFETAISLSRGKKGNDPNVLLAIGRANTDAKAGDIAYGLQKLNEAAQLAPTNAEIQLALGNANRKIQGNGSQAATAFIKASSLNPSWALPYYRLSKLYTTQQNWDIVVENLNKAIAADAKFAPAYLDLYYYYLLSKDFAKAEDFANKYIANSDKSVENDYIRAQTAFVQNKFDEAINTAKNIAAQAGEKTNPRVYRLLGYSYVGKGDSATACQYVGQFFAKVDPDDVVGADYILHADACGNNDPDVVVADFTKAIQMDSVLSNQIKFINEGIDRFKKAGKNIQEADLRLLAYKLRGAQANPAELFQIGLPYYRGRSFQRADSVFTAYATALPDSIYGYYWSAQARAQMDTTMEKGLAVPMYEKTLQIAEKNPTRFKTQGVIAAGYLMGHAFNIKKDKEAALGFVNRGLALDPQNPTLLGYKKTIEGSKQGGTRTQTSTSANSAKDGNTKVKTSSDGSVKKVKAK